MRPYIHPDRRVPAQLSPRLTYYQSTLGSLSSYLPYLTHTHSYISACSVRQCRLWNLIWLRGAGSNSDVKLTLTCH